MQNAIRSACREGNKETPAEEREKGYLARRRQRLAAFLAALWRRRSPRTAVPGGAAAVPDVRFPFFSMFRSSLFLPLPLFSQSVFLSSVFFSVFLSSRFLSSVGSSSLSPLFFFLFFSFFPISLLFPSFSFFLSSLPPFLSVLGLYL